jgi:hypothetical protein
MRKRARLRAAGPVLSTGLTPECVACTRGGCTAGTGCTWSRLQCNARVRSQVRAGWQHPVTGRVCRALAVSCTVTSGNVSHTDPVVERHFVMRGPRLPCNLPRQLTPAATWCSHMELSQSSHQGRAGTAARWGPGSKGSEHLCTAIYGPATPLSSAGHAAAHWWSVSCRQDCVGQRPTTAGHCVRVVYAICQPVYVQAAMLQTALPRPNRSCDRLPPSNCMLGCRMPTNMTLSMPPPPW